MLVFTGYYCYCVNIARQIAKDLLHSAMSKVLSLVLCVAALRQSLQKVEHDSTSSNASCNKNVAYVMIARHVTREVTRCNSACDLRPNKIAKQVARQAS